MTEFGEHKFFLSVFENLWKSFRGYTPFCHITSVGNEFVNIHVHYRRTSLCGDSGSEQHSIPVEALKAADPGPIIYEVLKAKFPAEATRLEAEAKKANVQRISDAIASFLVDSDYDFKSLAQVLSLDYTLMNKHCM